MGQQSQEHFLPSPLAEVAEANACTGEGDFSSHNLTAWPNSPISSTIFSVLPGGVVFSCSETKQNKQTQNNNLRWLPPFGPREEREALGLS